MAHSPGKTWRAAKSRALVSNRADRSPLASRSQASVRRPRWALSRARAAATVLLPTPPFPVTNSRRRSRSGRLAADGPGTAGLQGAEADAPSLGLRPNLYPRHLGRHHADPPTLAVGEPQDPGVLGDGLGDLFDDVVA